MFLGWLNPSLQQPVTLSSSYLHVLYVIHRTPSLLHIVDSGSCHYCKLDHCGTPLLIILFWRGCINCYNLYIKLCFSSFLLIMIVVYLFVCYRFTSSLWVNKRSWKLNSSLAERVFVEQLFFFTNSDKYMGAVWSTKALKVKITIL